MADRAGVGENIRIVGKRPPEEMPLYLALADVLLSPRTTGTNTPLKIYSYLWAGKAIVATDLETHRQVLDETVAVMAAPTREGLARAILDVVENAEKRSRSEQGRPVSPGSVIRTRFIGTGSRKRILDAERSVAAAGWNSCHGRDRIHRPASFAVG